MIIVDKSTVLPCPCCGAVSEFFGGLLSVGRISSTTFGVQCRCGLTIERGLPSTRIKGVESLDDAHAWATQQAVDLWNRRVSPKKMAKIIDATAAQGAES